jgi:hypothetical protein
MSGIVGSKLNHRGSGRVAKLGTDGQVLTSAGAGVSAVYEDAAGGGLDWQSVTTGSTLAAVAGNGYPIDTTSNTCTITLPGSASVGDQIIFTDYAGTWGTNKIILDSNGLNYQGDDDSYTVQYTTDDQVLHIVYIDTTEGWMPILDKAVTDDVPFKGNSEGLFGFGYHSWPTQVSMTNLVSNVGVVGTDVTGVGTARCIPGATEYGGDKAIIAFGHDGSGVVSMSNLVSNAGVVATDVTGVGTARSGPAACTYDKDKGIIGFGNTGSVSSLTNLVSSAGVVATDTTGVGTARSGPAACSYGIDKGIFGFGSTGTIVATTNLVSNAGVVASDVTGVGTARTALAACEYGADKGIFGFGTITPATAITNLVSNTGVVATDTTGVGTVRNYLAACEYGEDKGIFGYGTNSVTSNISLTNLVSSSGVVATDVTGVGTARQYLTACSFN